MSGLLWESDPYSKTKSKLAITKTTYKLSQQQAKSRKLHPYLPF